MLIGSFIEQSVCVNWRHQRKHQQAQGQGALIERKNAKHPAAIKKTVVTGVFASGQQNAGDQKARKDKEQIHARPAGVKNALDQLADERLRRSGKVCNYPEVRRDTRSTAIPRTPSKAGICAAASPSGPSPSESGRLAGAISTILPYRVHFLLERLSDQHPEFPAVSMSGPTGFAAQNKALTKRRSDGQLVHSFRTLPGNLATLARNRVRPIGADDAAPSR